MGHKPRTSNETKDTNNTGRLKWAPQALRPLVSCILSLVSYKKIPKKHQAFPVSYYITHVAGKIQHPRHSNSKFESVRHLALNLARALARNNTASKSMIKSKSKKKAGRKDNTLLNLELLSPAKGI